MAGERNEICIKEIEQLKSSTKSAHKRLDEFKSLVDLFHDMNRNMATIANETSNQGKQLEAIVGNMIKQGEKIDTIEEKMETKDTVSKLADRVEIVERKSGEEAEKMLKQVKWLLLSLSLTAIFGMVWLAFTKGGAS